MPFPDIARLVVAAALSGVLCWASVSDVRDRRIPNRAVLAVIALFGVWTLLDAGGGLLSGVLAAALGFTVGYALYLLKVMGAGDVKLFSAAALFAGIGYLPALTLVMALTGGAMALASFAARPRRAAVMVALRGRGDFGRGIPYGVAISAGCAVVVWGLLIGLLPSAARALLTP